MIVSFTDQEMMHFLEARHYRIAKFEGAFTIFDGPIEEIKTEKVLVAFKGKEWDEVGKLYWREEINERCGLETVFNKELKKSLLKI